MIFYLKFREHNLIHNISEKKMGWLAHELQNNDPLFILKLGDILFPIDDEKCI